MIVQIVKNEKSIKEFPCTELTLQKVFDKAIDMAGGMWNGKDEFLVIIQNEKHEKQ